MVYGSDAQQQKSENSNSRFHSLRKGGKVRHSTQYNKKEKKGPKKINLIMQSTCNDITSAWSIITTCSYNKTCSFSHRLSSIKNRDAPLNEEMHTPKSRLLCTKNYLYRRQIVSVWFLIFCCLPKFLAKIKCHQLSVLKWYAFMHAMVDVLQIKLKNE